MQVLLQEIPVTFEGADWFVDPITFNLQANSTHIPCNKVKSLMIVASKS